MQSAMQCILTIFYYVILNFKKLSGFRYSINITSDLDLDLDIIQISKNSNIKFVRSNIRIFD